MAGQLCNICMVDQMTQVLIDTKVVKNALAAVDKFCLKVQTGQAKSVETYHDLMLVGNDLRAALANAERVEPDTQRLNWLGQNFYSRENLDFITGRPSKTHTMWVFFAPIKVQGDIRRVLDAAKDEK